MLTFWSADEALMGTGDIASIAAAIKVQEIHEKIAAEKQEKHLASLRRGEPKQPQTFTALNQRRRSRTMSRSK